MAESGEDYTPGDWKGWNYTSARAAYSDPNAGRSYSTPSTSSYSGSIRSRSTGPVGDLVPDKLTVTAKSPVVVITDGTGSMGEFPEVIFKKLPLLDDGVKDYLEDPAICYAMVGDAVYDKLPLQVQPFGLGKEMVDRLNSLTIEGGGGGNQHESYELAALYFARNVEMPNAVKPVLIFICDEGVSPEVNAEEARNFAKVELTERTKTGAVFKELAQKYSVYCIRKHYGNGRDAVDGDKLVGLNATFHEQWQKLIGAERVALLDDPKRVVDVILGLLAVETGKMDFFTKEITVRQTKDQVKTVFKAMDSIAKKTAKSVHTGNSIVKRPKGGKTKSTDSLL